jgi:hypothetical protein
MAQYLAEGDVLRDAVNAHRAARGASAESPPPKSQRLPPAQYPTEIPGFPLNPTPPAEIPNYASMARLKATRAAVAERRGKRATLKPIGEPTLRKRDNVSRR